MDMSSPLLQLMIQATRDAIVLARQDLGKADPDQAADYEEYLMLLGNLQAELKAEYEGRRAKGEKLLPYDLLSGQPRFRKL
jgi:hypothetical protein